MDYGSFFLQIELAEQIWLKKVSLLTLGLEFEKQNFNNEKILGFNVGNIFKDKKNPNITK